MTKQARTGRKSPARNGRKTAGGSDPQIRSIVNRLVKLEDEKRTISETIGSVYAEAKDKDLDVPVIRATVKVLRESITQRQKRERIESSRDVLLHQLGALADTELGHAAMQRADKIYDITERRAAAKPDALARTERRPTSEAESPPA